MTLEIPEIGSEGVDTFLLAIGDDEFLMGHRLSYWVARGPTIEVDNEMSAIVQDELGHARLWYELLVDGETLDDLAFGRPASERRNTLLVEPPVSDFGETVVRQFLYDRAEQLLLSAIRDGIHDELSARAEVALREEEYHREHADIWLDRLSETEEGREHLEAGFESCLPRCRDLFAFDENVGTALSDAGVVDRSFETLRAEWIEEVVATLEELPLEVDLGRSSDESDEAHLPDVLADEPETNGRLGEHTDALADLVENGFTEF